MKQPKIAIVADWLTTYGGAEKVISAFHSLYPEAPIYTTLFNSEKMKELAAAQVVPSFLQKIPFAQKNHKPFLSLMPHAIERLDLSDFDIVISSSHSVAKGVLTKVETMHLCYCHNPMRYCWDDWQNYIREWGLPQIANHFIYKKLHKIRMWDRLAADRVDYYVANSSFVAQRIFKYYRRESEVLPPPVDIEKYSLVENPQADYFFTAGRLVPFKRFDLIVETFNRLGLKLKIAGSGPELKKLQKMAGQNVEVLGFVDDRELEKLYQNCAGFIFAHTEDAGITPFEAMSCGRPVIAFNAGGARETVIEGQTGTFFDEQTVDCLQDTIQNFRPEQFNPEAIRNHALQYDRTEFMRKFKSIVERQWGEWGD